MSACNEKIYEKTNYKMQQLEDGKIKGVTHKISRAMKDGMYKGNVVIPVITLC